MCESTLGFSRPFDHVLRPGNVRNRRRHVRQNRSGVNNDPVNPTRGLAAYTNVVQKYHTAFPDCRLDIDELIATGDTVVERWRYSGTHRGMLEGLPPTGRRANGTGITICRFSGNLIREAFVNWDALGLMQQLGAVTMPGRVASAGA